MKRSYRRKIEEFQIGDIVTHYYLKPVVWYIITGFEKDPYHSYAICHDPSDESLIRHVMHLDNLIKIDEEQNA